jgi:hypothetical protein
MLVSNAKKKLGHWAQVFSDWLAVDDNHRRSLSRSSSEIV